MRRQLGWLCILPALASLTPNPTAAAGVSFSAAMQSASQARNVPLPLIEATAYVNSRWEWISAPAADGGVGPMHVMPSQLAAAVALSGHSQAQVASDLSANIDAGAALLAKQHASGSDLASWRPAVVATQGSFVATQIFNALRSGETGTASTGEQIVLSPQALPSLSPAPKAPAGAAPAPAQTDYPGATWVPADLANYSYGSRPHDYPVQMIVIHDIEGSYGSAIQLFQDPNTQASANYVVSDLGEITQMVAEKDIAWHAGNWDYNTRSIGIEHEGYAYAQPTWYTTAMYQASAHLAASICSRWGVPMDRTHVIGHAEVPDPNNPGLYGGVDHHTDPGPYWDWTYYMSLAQSYANALPSPPRMGPDPVAVNGVTSATVTWQAAQTCHSPITGYTVTGQPGNLVKNLPASATTATFNNLQPGTSHTFTVTAINPDGQDSLTSNAVTPGRCNQVHLAAAPDSPQRSGTAVRLTGTSAGCPNPLYQFWTQAPGSSTWQLGQAYSTSPTFNWNTTGQAAGDYSLGVWARDSNSPGTNSNSLGTYDDSTGIAYTVTPPSCTSVTESAAPPSPSTSGTQATFTATASGCPKPLYEFWARWQGYSTWQLLQGYSTSNVYHWNSTGAAPGTEYVGVWAKDSSSPTGTFDANLSIPYSVTTPACGSVTVAATPTSVMHGSGTVTITGAASGCTNANPLYEFWMRPASLSTWQLVQGYSTSATYDWNSTGAAAGTVYFGVWAKDAGSPNTVDTYASKAVTVT